MASGSQPPSTPSHDGADDLESVISRAELDRRNRPAARNGYIADRPCGYPFTVRVTPPSGARPANPFTLNVFSPAKPSGAVTSTTTSRSPPPAENEARWRDGHGPARRHGKIRGVGGGDDLAEMRITVARDGRGLSTAGSRSHSGSVGSV